MPVNLAPYCPEGPPHLPPPHPHLPVQHGSCRRAFRLQERSPLLPGSWEPRIAGEAGADPTPGWGLGGRWGVPIGLGQGSRRESHLRGGGDPVRGSGQIRLELVGGA